MSEIVRSIKVDWLDDPRKRLEVVLKDPIYDLPIFLVSELQKHWSDLRSNIGYTLFPRKLSITWSDDSKYWTWFTIKEESSNETVVEGVELRDVCWLEITGKFDTRYLTQGTTYMVSFKVKLGHPAYGWETPVNLKLVLPNGKQQEKKVSLKDQSKHEWFDIDVGLFVADKSNIGEITFSMFEYEAGGWKKGLFLRSLTICPLDDFDYIGS